MKSGSDALKAANIKWLVALAVLDVAIALFLARPELVSAGQLAILRASALTIFPVSVLDHRVVVARSQGECLLKRKPSRQPGFHEACAGSARIA